MSTTTTTDRPTFNAAPDLERGVYPISRAASALAALIKRARATHRPIIVTQKGYATGVLLSVEDFTDLVRRADGPDVAGFLEGEWPGDEA